MCDTVGVDANPVFLLSTSDASETATASSAGIESRSRRHRIFRCCVCYAQPREDPTETASSTAHTAMSTWGHHRRVFRRLVCCAKPDEEATETSVHTARAAILSFAPCSRSIRRWACCAKPDDAPTEVDTSFAWAPSDSEGTYSSNTVLVHQELPPRSVRRRRRRPWDPKTEKSSRQTGEPTPTSSGSAESSDSSGTALVYQGHRHRLFHRWTSCKLIVDPDNKLKWQNLGSAAQYSLNLADAIVIDKGRCIIRGKVMYELELRTAYPVTIHRFAVPTRALCDEWLAQFKRCSHMN